VAAGLSGWLAQQPQDPTAPVFPTATGKALSADALQRLVARHVRTAAGKCASLRRRRVTPHTLRHTTAMNLLQRGVDITVIALWLGHESIESTQNYLHADMVMKEKALAHATHDKSPIKRYRPADPLLAFLESL
jgi:site-specific recombinase XerD